jgi:prevent-host-death family protein
MAIRATDSLKTISAKDAKYGFGKLIDTARAEPVTVEKHGPPVVVVISVEEYERLLAVEHSQKTDVERKMT